MERNWNFKNVFMLCVAALLAATTTYAIPKGPCEEKPVVCCQEPAPGPFAFSYAKDLGLSCPRDFYIYGEFLLMQVEEDGLDLAIINTNSDIIGNAFPLDGGNIKGFSTGHSTWDFSPGFRVGFGSYLSRDMWNIDVMWTYLHSNEKTSASNRQTGVVVPLNTVPSVISSTNFDNAKLAKAKWEFTLNSLDIVMSKPFHASRYFVLSPMLGFRAAFIDQDLTENFFGTFQSEEGRQSMQNGLKVLLKNDFWGVGLRGALNTEWLLGSGWNLFGKVGCSMLYSKFDVEQSLSFADSGYEIDHNFYTVVPTMDIAVGINWGHYFSHNKYRFSMRAAYEFHYWWKQNHLKSLFEHTSEIMDAKGDLQFAGFSFGVQFDF